MVNKIKSCNLVANLELCQIIELICWKLALLNINMLSYCLIKLFLVTFLLTRLPNACRRVFMCRSPWQIPLHISIALPRSKRCSAELPLRARLIRVSVDLSGIHTTILRAMSPTLNVLQVQVQSTYALPFWNSNYRINSLDVIIKR